jgi:hypothetical protein
VQKRILSITTVALLFLVIFVSCSKLDTTDIGNDLLPAVDNITTFEEILTINTTQGVFTTDSTQVSRINDHVLGKISNDPLFGTTTASIYAQFKPTFYPYHNNIPKDSFVAFDSVVLCLSYKGGWGDTINTLLQLQVKEIPYVLNNNGRWDSVTEVKDINFAPAMIGSVIGNATINIPSLSSYFKYANGKDSAKNQIRIKLSSTFANSLFARDSIDGSPTGSFRSDSLYSVFNNGFAIEASGTGNALLYTNFSDAATKLEIHYRKKNGATIDTTYSSFKVATVTNGNVKISSTANKIVRNRPAFTSPDEIYLQTTPGSYANLSIPALATLSNRIIHRAEIIVEQIPDPASPLLSAPNFLYIDLKDTGNTVRWKPIYFDLNPAVSYNPDNNTVYSFFLNSGIDFAYHGGFQRKKTDQLSGSEINYYNFNITRYVQQIVTRGTTNYALRLYAPYNLSYPQYSFVVPYFNRLASGRVKVGGGNNANYKMRLRIVYSKI